MDIFDYIAENPFKVFVFIFLIIITISSLCITDTLIEINNKIDVSNAQCITIDEIEYCKSDKED